MYARDVPRLRAHMSTWARDPGRDGAAAWLSTVFAMEDEDGTARTPDEVVRAGPWLARILAAQFPAAHLFHVAPDMLELARTAGARLPDYTVHPHDLPAEVGFMALGAPMHTRCAREESEPVRLLTWGPCEGGTMLTVWVEPPDWLTPEFIPRPGASPLPRSRQARRVRPRHGLLLSTTIRYLSPRAQALAFDEGSEVQRSVLAMWLLMGQTLSVSERQAPDRATRRAVAREDPALGTDVSYIYLRRRRTVRDSTDSDAPGRNYRHQWWVQGHWRNQWYARRDEHRPIWISPHLAGPEDAPLLGTERVNLWRR
ncbi:hypothetical protein CLV63_11222 [Murinocardiopsis flavida]|uniref:Uncharacterized protein n=1 Tax=Murinocardiopsis flavida TaxID=645275 RepID=A0A2P8DFZ8_9ACTN|nr:hypothetical protein [Murinocardiopsis flavida]PSK96140.1 hypothetical protein CLV63_11222 [Murinocardiopsis flavida]